MTDLISIDPEVMGGTPCFRESRVPVSVLFNNLTDGLSLDEIFDSYPSMPRDAISAALKQGAFPLHRVDEHVGKPELLMWKTLLDQEFSKLNFQITREI